jgi:hypothetical protein
MKRFLILICIATFSACQPLSVNSVTSTPNEEAKPRLSTSTIISATQFLSNTTISTSVLSETPFPTETATQFPAKLFNPTVIQTITPSLPSQCPKDDAKLQFSVEDLYASASSAPAGEGNQYFTKYILDFLNSGGTPKSILFDFQKLNAEQINTYFRVDDITGDKVAELVFAHGIWLDVFACKNGKYELAFTDTYESDLNGVAITDVTDINKDGLADVIVNFDGCMGNRCPIIRVYEWNGSDFQNLIADPYDRGIGCSSLAVVPFEVKIQDTDNNGTKEIILSNNGFVQPDNDFPYRKETRICMWNGQNIVVYKTEFDAPYYRFQAVQDGDRATLSGDYNQALSFYEQTINDKQLEWFTQDRKWYDFWVYHSKIYSSEPTPTASPALVPDPNEYPTLAAYAYYRIMLLHILQNDGIKAESTFNTLQSEFPPENYFAQVAFVFWQEYQLSMNIQSPCRKVIEYAQEHPVPVEYLGDWDHGVHSIQYAPETICPFR